MTTKQNLKKTRSMKTDTNYRHLLNQERRTQERRGICEGGGTKQTKCVKEGVRYDGRIV
jgi:hypothetical protein